MNLLLNGTATLFMFPFVMVSMNITVNHKRQDWFCLIAILFCAFIIWRIWA